MASKKDLEKRVLELEYRLRVLEKFLNQSNPLFRKNDESLMNSIRLEVIQELKQEGILIELAEEGWGTGLDQKNHFKRVENQVTKK